MQCDILGDFWHQVVRYDIAPSAGKRTGLGRELLAKYEEGERPHLSKSSTVLSNGCRDSVDGKRCTAMLYDLYPYLMHCRTGILILPALLFTTIF